jgi:protein-disulfide isomerase
MAFPKCRIAFLMILGLTAGPLFPQSQGAQSQTEADLRKEIELLKTQMKAMQSDLDQIKAALRDQNARANPVFDITAAPSKGDPNAKVVMIEFSDFECPFCREYTKTIYNQILETYVTPGKVRYVFVDFPGEKIHPHALKAAEAARCANEQGKFWEMHDQLFARQKDLGSSGIGDAAQAAGLKKAEFDACFASGKYSEPVVQVEQANAKLGMTGTPTFVFATPDPSNPSKVKMVRALVGGQPYSAFQQILDSLVTK